MCYEKVIDKFIGSLSYFQAVNLRMVLLHAYSPYRSLEDIYTQASDEFMDSDKLKYDLKQAINCPTPLLADKAMQQAEKTGQIFLDKILNNATEIDKVERENNDLFNKLKKEFDKSEAQSDEENKQFKAEFDKIQQENEKFANQVKKDMKKYMDGEE